MFDPICVGTTSRIIPISSFARALTGLGMGMVMALSAGGCGVVSQTKMDEYHRVAQTLRAENTRLKDVALDLRARNQDLTQRAVDDAKRLSTQEEVVTRLENSVQAYQAEREKLADAFESLKQQVRLAVNSDTTQAAAEPPPAAEDTNLKPERLEAFAKEHEGWTFDSETKVFSAPVDRLFEPGKAKLTDDALKTLKALALELTQTEATASTIEVMALGDAPSPVEKAGFHVETSPDAPGPKAAARFLATSRAARVREQLVVPGGLAPKLVRIVAPPVSAENASDDTGQGSTRRVEIRLASVGKAIDVFPGRSDP